MNKRFTLTLALASITLAALAGCSSAGTNTTTAPGAGGSGTTQTSAPASGTDLATATTSLGKVVVDSKGMTVYVFDKDTPNSGKSACAGVCVGNWPAVTTTASDPSVDGVNGTVGTITTADGKTQLTLNGLPLYTYAGDSAAGDVKGQGVMGIWWAVTPSGDKVTTSANGY